MSLQLLQDIHLSDDEFWKEFRYYWETANYQRALEILNTNQELITKYVDAEWFNSLTSLIYYLETLPNDFNKKQIKVSYLPPDLEVGDIWFQLELGELKVNVSMETIYAGSTSVVVSYTDILINAIAFQNSQEVLVDQTIDETNSTVTFSIGKKLDSPVICMVFSTDYSGLVVYKTTVPIGMKIFSYVYSGNILSVMFLKQNVKNIINIYDYNSNELFFKTLDASEAGILRVCSIPSNELTNILNKSSGILDNNYSLNLLCEGYMVNSILTQEDSLELETITSSGDMVELEEPVGGSQVQDLTVAIDPVQDLHGYDHPWPAGGGKNKFDPQYFTGDVDTIYLNFHGARNVATAHGTHVKANTTYTCTIQLPATPSAPWGIYGYYANDSATVITFSANGIANPRTFSFTPTEDTDVIMWAYMSGSGNTWSNQGVTSIDTVRVQIEQGSTATSYAPYSNECPISGWTEANLWRTGINVCEEVFEDGYISANGALQPYANAIRSKNYNSCVPGEQYYYHITQGISGVNIAWYDVSKTFIQRDSDKGNTVITAPSNAYYFKLSIYNYKAVNPAYANDISINYPSTGHDYHAYSGNQYTIQLGQTVYGGTPDVTNGVLTVDRGIITDFSQLSQTADLAQDGTYRWRITASNVYSGASQKTISSFAPYKRDFNFGGIRFFNYANNLIFIFLRNNDRDEVLALLDGQQIIYELATPITIPLTPITVRTIIEEQNNFWADSGNIDITYFTNSSQATGSEIFDMDGFVLANTNLDLTNAIISIQDKTSDRINCTLYYT